MTENRDALFLSILAMDSYNRGYDVAVLGLDVEEDKTKLGGATIKSQSDIEPGSLGRDSSFYAIAYEWNNRLVISYRGADGLSDLLNGWTTGTGWSDRAQARLAIEFYEGVTGRWVHSPAAPPAVTLTGHSLGGGLAGLVSALSGAQLGDLGMVFRVYGGEDGISLFGARGANDNDVAGPVRAAA